MINASNGVVPEFAINSKLTSSAFGTNNIKLTLNKKPQIRVVVDTLI
jgi:hypothetical protein